MDRPARVAAAAEVPVVVLAGAGLVVVDQRVDRPRRAAGSRGVACAAGAVSPRRRTAGRRSRRAAGTAGTGSRRPCRGSPGRAGPSPRGRRASASSTDRPHQRQSNVARGRVVDAGHGAPASARAASSRRGGDVSTNAVGVEDLGQHLDPVDDPRARAARSRPSRRPRTRCRAGPPRSASSRSGCGVGSHSATVSLRWKPHGISDEHLGVDLGDRAASRSGPSARRPGRGGPSRRRAGSAPAPSGRPRTADRATRARRRAAPT